MQAKDFPQSVHLAPSDLIFNEKEDYSFLYGGEKRGTVGNLAADRAPEWNLFVVVDYDEESKTYALAFPRVRFLDGVVHLGQDKLSSEELDRQDRIMQRTSNKCACPSPFQGDSFYCHCGAEKRRQESYSLSFQSVGEQGGHYMVKTFVASNIPCLLYLEHTRVGYLEHLDEPLIFCRGTHEPRMF